MKILSTLFFLLVCTWSSISIAASFSATKVVTSWGVTCALSTDGDVKCWGDNYFYNLGTGDNYNYGYYPYSMGVHLPVAKFGTNVKAADLCVGDNFTCIATPEGKVKCLGVNLGGGLGHEDSEHTRERVGDLLPYTNLGSNFRAKSLTCGVQHVCALNSEGRAKCWGPNNAGQLDLGNRSDRGDRPGHMGENLPFVSTTKPIRILSAGNSSTCALFDEGIKCWGDGEDGQMGQEHREDIAATPDTKNLDKLPFIRLEAADVSIKIRKISMSANHACALYEKNKQDHVKCWGDNRVGQLGVGDLAQTHGGEPQSMGSNLPRVDVGFEKIADIQAYSEFTCALSTLGQVKCWGLNEDGQLGLGDTINRGGAPNQMGTNLPVVDLGLPVKALAQNGHASHVCVILINGLIKCWGDGKDGQLGYEDGKNRGVAFTDMGLELPFVNLYN